MLTSLALLAFAPLPPQVLAGEVITPLYPRRVITGDLNQDGRSDALLVGSIASEVLFGGDNGVSTGLAFTTEFNPDDAAIGDLNGDGTPDWVVGYGGIQSAKRVDVFLNQGTSVLAVDSVTDVERPSAVALGDLNLDGDLDLVARYQKFPADGFSVLMGDGAGGFALNYHRTGAGASRSLALSDFNSDGHLDLAGAVDQSVGAISGVNVFFGLGGGEFGQPSVLNPNNRMSALLVADLDNDGDDDIASTGFDDMFVHLGDGAGGFVQTATYDISEFAGLFPVHIAAGDLNEDGLMEIVLPMVSVGDSLFFRPLGGGQYSAPETLVAGTVTEDLAIADFTGDGSGELLNSVNGMGVVVLDHDGNGGVTTFPTIQTPTRPRDLVVADFTADGFADLAIASTGLQIVAGTANGGFGATQTLADGQSLLELQAADFGQDGVLDILAVVENVGLQVFQGDGAGGLVPDAPILTPAAPGALVAGDVTSDGVLDAIVAQPDTGELLIYIGDGLGGFLALPIAMPTLGPVGVMELADWSGDGALDLAIELQLLGGDAVEILSGDGNGNFAFEELLIHDNVTDLLCADLDEDGDIDLAVADNAQNRIVRWIVEGGVFFEDFAAFAQSVSRIAWGDLDGDGNLELVSASSWSVTALELSEFEPNAFFFLDEGAYIAPSFGDSSTVVADWNGDGRQDLFSLSSRVIYSENVSEPAVGLTPIGSGTSGPLGAHGLLGTTSPVLGSEEFGFTCTQAPANQVGLAWISDTADASGVLVSDLLIHALPGGAIFVTLDMESNAAGYGRAELPVPTNPVLEGLTLNAQVLWNNGAAGPSTSNGLEFVIQP